MIKLGFLYPPTGAEHEYYTAAAMMRPAVRAYVVGVRIAGGEREHEPRHLRKTAAVDNLLLSAASLAPIGPDAVMWACTSGSFIDGLDFAHRQARSLSRRLKVPCSSTSLAFVNALSHLRVNRVAVLSSYPARTARAFHELLGAAGVEVTDHVSLNAMSGPAAARLGDRRLAAAARWLDVPVDGALLVPDTAMPTLTLLDRLERELDRTVLSANQVTLWEALRLAGGPMRHRSLGRLFSGKPVQAISRRRSVTP